MKRITICTWEARDITACGGAALSTGPAAVAEADVPRVVVYLFALCALVGAPLFEELCFRGLAFAAAARWAHARGLPAVPWATISSALPYKRG